jgi:hypothetical protein
MGALPAVRFHPGTDAGSSNRASSPSAEIGLDSDALGRRSRVREKPGIFKLVYQLHVSHEIVSGSHIRSYHECARDNALYSDFPADEVL